MKLSDAKLANFQKTHIIVESNFDDTYYAIPKDGGGIIIISDGREIPILNENVIDFTSELLSVWNLYRR